MSKSALLLDFDGVLFRNRQCLRAVERKSSRFTRLHIPEYNPHTHGDYRSHGHTVHLINSVAGHGVTMEEYNEYVFTPSLIDHVLWHFDGADERRVKAWKGFASMFDHPCIFSNAPDEWVVPLIGMLGIDSFVEDVHTSTSMGCLKPSLNAYHHALKGVYEKGVPKGDVLFVDDSSTNTNTAMNLGITSCLYTDATDRCLLSFDSSDVRWVDALPHFFQERS